MQSFPQQASGEQLYPLEFSPHSPSKYQVIYFQSEISFWHYIEFKIQHVYTRQIFRQQIADYSIIAIIFTLETCRRAARTRSQ